MELDEKRDGSEVEQPEKEKTGENKEPAAGTKGSGKTWRKWDWKEKKWIPVRPPIIQKKSEMLIPPIGAMAPEE